MFDTDLSLASNTGEAVTHRSGRAWVWRWVLAMAWLGALLLGGGAQAQVINTIAGSGTQGFSGDTGQAPSAQLNFPTGVAVDSAGNFYIADSNNHRIRKVATSGTITTVAGNGTQGFSGDFGLATNAQLNYPQAVTVSSAGDLYIADLYNHRIRKVTPGGTITTVAGNGTQGFSGDAGPATNAQLRNPFGVAMDSMNNLYIADYNNQRIRKVTAGGTITTVAGNGTYGFSGDAGPATSAQLNNPTGVAVDGLGTIYIADQNNHRIRKVTPGGTITTVVGNGTQGFNGDSVLATNAILNYPQSVKVDSAGNLYIADLGNHRIRRVGDLTPVAPSSVTATPGNTQAVVNWTPPVANGGSPLTGYTVTASSGGGTCTPSPATATSCTVSGLGNGTAYTFTVVASNAAGNSPPSPPSNSVTPFTVPDAPGSVTATPGNGSAAISWAAPADNGSAVTGYTVTASGGSTCTATPPATGCTLGGLVNGTAYTFTVVATNAAGDSAAAPGSVTPRTVPDAPASVTAVPGNAQATVSWAAPANGGSPLTGYTVTASNGAMCTATPPVTSCVVAGLTNGTAYTFTVVATNAAGNSLGTTSGSVTPFTVPGAPTGVSGVAGNAQATVSWAAPASNGGSVITGYTVTALGGSGGTCTTSGTSCAVTSLTNGTAYTFTVKAANAAGDSVASAASASVTPFTVPDAPTGVSGVPGNAQATVSWTAPANTGSSAITGYTVTAIGGSGGSCSAVAPATTCVMTALTNGTAYTFTVLATNAAGNSAASAPSASVTPFTVPDAPTGVTAASGNAQATVSWAAPASNGGSAITSYTVTALGGSGGTCTTSGTSCAVTGLTNGTAYTFTVKATNAAGDSVASAPSASVTPFTVPDAPTGVTATAANGQATVSWTAPANTGGSTITGYTVTAIGGSGGTCAAVAPATSCVVSSLTNGTAYTFTVKATNAAGDSVASAPSASVTPMTVPDAPTGVSATAANGQATVSWTAPANTGGSPLTGYTVTASNGATCTATPPTTNCVVTGLTNGTAYTFTVVATNTAGSSAASAPSASVTPATVPGAPTAVSGVPGNAQVTVSWVAPVSTGGSAITGYTVTAIGGSGGSCVALAPTTSCAVTGLTNGTAYTFTVVATNAAGPSAASAPSASVTPFTVPDAPTNVTATAGAGQAVVGWTAPANNGGSAITLYTVTAIPGAALQSAGLALQAAPAGGTCTATPPATSCTVTGLTPGVPYTFTVVATNAAGDSVASVQSNSVTPYALSVQPVPALGTWALALLAALLGGVAALRQRRAAA